MVEKKKIVEVVPLKSSYLTPHKESIQNPDKNNPYVGINSAWKNENWDRMPEEYFRIGNDGRPEKLISPEAYLNDASAFWQMHEQALIIIIVLCVFYLLLVVL